MKNKETKKNKWFYYPQKFAIKEENLFGENTVQFPVVLYLNKRTGEIRLFARDKVEKIGLNNVEII